MQLSPLGDGDRTQCNVESLHTMFMVKQTATKRFFILIVRIFIYFVSCF